MNKFAMTLLFGILIGCITSNVVQPLVIPPAHANQKKRWEYKCVNPREAGVDNADAYRLSSENGWARIMNQFGGQGWEVDKYFYIPQGDRIGAICFKREA